MKRLKGYSAVVTGATSGIGLELSKILIQEQINVFLIGRNFKELKSIINKVDGNDNQIQLISADFTNDAELDLVIDGLTKENRIDFLIHSAGVISMGPLEIQPVRELDNQYKVNVRAPFLITQMLLPALKKAKGKIIFINSTAGLTSKENNSQYSATKYALKAMANSLRKEVEKFGIAVTSIYPRSTATPMQEYVQKIKGNIYSDDDFINPKDVAVQVIHILKMKENITMTDIIIG